MDSNNKDLLIQPWKGKSINGINILLKYIRNNNGYQILVTDLKDIWYEELSIADIKERNKELNSKIEVIAEEITNHLDDNVYKSEATFLVKNLSKEKLCLLCSSVLYELKYTWEFRLQSASRQMFAEHLTVPLFSMMAELQRQQTELCKLLVRKDTEIEEYKFAGVKISKHSLTNPFDESSFFKNSLQSKEFLKLLEEPGLISFSEGMQDLYSAVMKAKKQVMAKKSKDDEKKVIPEKDSLPKVSKDPVPHSNDTNKEKTNPKDEELQRRLKLEQKLSQTTATPEVKRKRKKLFNL